MLIRDAQRRGALDDRACTRLWAGQWARQGFADGAIRERLAGKGLPSSLIEEAMARLAQGGDD